jgi:methionine-rich copper-binding protein CopC
MAGPVRLLAAALAVALALSLGSGGVALAHARYVRSEPAQGTSVATPPERVTVFFSALLTPTGSTLTVVDGAGATVSQGAAQVVPSDQHAMQIALRPALGPGTYTVRWQSVSAEDGEDDSGTFSFTVGGALLARSGGFPPGSTVPLFGALGIGLAVGGLTWQRWGGLKTDPAGTAREP